MTRRRGSCPLQLVEADRPIEAQPLVPTGAELEAAIAGSVDRRAWLRREAAAEEARLKWLGRRLATERGVAFIRLEALDREFGR